jgi:hypothetical protein
MRIMLAQFIDPGAAADAAEGWGGDRFELLQSATGDLALAISSVWDSEPDAIDFAARYQELMVRRYGRRAARTEAGPNTVTWTNPNGSLLLRRTGLGVVIIMAPNDRVMNALADAVARSSATPATGPRPAPQQAPVQIPR